MKQGCILLLFPGTGQTILGLGLNGHSLTLKPVLYQNNSSIKEGVRTRGKIGCVSVCVCVFVFVFVHIYSCALLQIQMFSMCV